MRNITQEGLTKKEQKTNNPAERGTISPDLEEPNLDRVHEASALSR